MVLQLKLDQSNKEITNLEKEISTLKSEKTQMTQYIRDLEQKNDDLERSRRIIEESIAGIESAFNTAIERNAILESEVDEKETLKEKLQRLLDERRGTHCNKPRHYPFVILLICFIFLV